MRSPNGSSRCTGTLSCRCENDDVDVELDMSEIRCRFGLEMMEMLDLVRRKLSEEAKPSLTVTEVFSRPTPTRKPRLKRSSGTAVTTQATAPVPPL